MRGRLTQSVNDRTETVTKPLKIVLKWNITIAPPNKKLQHFQFSLSDNRILEREREDESIMSSVKALSFFFFQMRYK